MPFDIQTKGFHIGLGPEISQIFYLTGHILDLVELVHFHTESDFYKKYTNSPHRF